MCAWLDRIGDCEDRRRPSVPTVHLALDEDAAGMTALDLVRRLQDGTPSVHANPSRVHDGLVMFSPVALKPGDEMVIAERVRGALQTPSR